MADDDGDTDQETAVTGERMSQLSHSIDGQFENRSCTDQIRVLYVEDDPNFAELAVTCLEDETDRVSIERAPSAAKGLERLGDGIDCIVSDYNMPGMDGIELLENVRESYPDLPFILFTGKGSEEVASDAISSGVTDYLQKESGTEQFTVLANRVANAVEKERVREQLAQQTEQLDTVLSHSPLISFALDADGVFTLSRGKALDKLGLMPGEVVGESVFDVFADNPDIIAAAETALDGEQTTGTHEVAGAVYQTTYSPVFDDGTVSAVTGVAVDITERKQRERRFEALVEESGDLISVLDADGVFQYNSPSIERILGHDPAETIGDTAWEYIHPDDREAVRETFEEWRANPGMTATVEYRARHADGSWRWMEARGTNQQDNAPVEGYVVNSRDITDREAYERELEAQRQRFRNLFEHLSQPTAELEYVDDEPIVRRINDAFAETFGYEGADIVGESLDDFIVPEDRQEEANELNDRVQETGQLVSEEVTRQTASGQREFLLQNAVYDDGSKAFTIYTDITERVERQRELEILRQAIDNAHIPLILSDPSQEDNPLVYVNDAFEDATGYAQSEAIGRNCRFLQGEATDPDQVATLREAMDNEEQVTVELRNYRKDGEMFWNRVTVRPIYDEDGNLLRYFGSQQNISERREATERLERQNDRLDEFARTVAHDLQNPLRVADGRLELASEECDSEHLDAVADALDRSQTLIDDLLTLARNGIRIEQTEPVEVAGAVEECDWLVEAADTSLAVETDAMVVADPDRLRQLLENLLRNALEHGGDGVDIRVGELDDEPGFFVADDGSGISATERDKVFESGYSTADDGTGFGLAIVEEIVSEHGWEISVTDSQSGGARFEITGVKTRC